MASMSESKSQSYVFLELKEYTENFDKEYKDPRFILLKHVALSRLLLLDPKSTVDPNNLQKVCIYL